MSTRVVVAGTDTDIGKTVFAAALTQALDGYYWKPVQAGLEGETDCASRAAAERASRPRAFCPRPTGFGQPPRRIVAAELDDIRH